MKEKFNRAQYTSRRYVMHCRTKEEFDAFLTYLDGIGEKWQDNSYLGMSYLWDISKTNTVFYFNNGNCGVSNCYTAKTNGYIILEYSDFDWGAEANPFSKSDLKNGDVVKHSNGEVGIAIVDVDTIIYKNGATGLCNYRNNLTCIVSSAFDIVAVKRPSSALSCQFGAFDNAVGKLIYERKEEPGEMTLAEVCKLLGKEIKIVK